MNARSPLLAASTLVLAVLYISHRTKISTLEPDGTVRDLVTGLPSLGDLQNNQLAVGTDGRIFFGPLAHA